VGYVPNRHDQKGGKGAELTGLLKARRVRRRKPGKVVEGERMVGGTCSEVFRIKKKKRKSDQMGCAHTGYERKMVKKGGGKKRTLSDRTPCGQDAHGLAGGKRHEGRKRLGTSEIGP